MRKEGYYWVNYIGEWQIGQWHKERWCIMRSSMSHDDSDFFQIIEDKIDEPLIELKYEHD